MPGSSAYQLEPGKHGETVKDGRRFIRGPDGVTILDGEQAIGPRVPTKRDHDENLADRMRKGDRKNLAQRLLEYMDVDIASRADWEQREQIGLALMGINELPEDLAERAADVESPGLAQVKMPLMIQAMVTFQSRAIAEMFPSEGPVKTQVLGKHTREREEQAARIRNFGNYYLTQVDKGYFPDTNQMLLYLPKAGSSFRKAGINWVTGLPELRYVKATNFIVPYSATSLEQAPRYAHRYTMTGQEIRRAMEQGRFCDDVRLHKPSVNQAKHPKVADVSDYRTPSEHDDDALYSICEYHIDLELECDRLGRPEKDGGSWRLLPYVVLVEEENQEILLIRRNWAKADKSCRKILWFTHHKFFPGLGFYGWGYPHVVGSLAKAVNDGVNAMLDAEYAANFRGGFVTKEGKAVGMGGEMRLEHGVYKALDGTYEEISKALFSPEFKGTTPGMAKLVEMLIQAFERFGSITEAAVGDADNRGPVGTTLALIEQSSVVPTAIHKALHVSMGNELQMWAQLVSMYMPNQYEYEQAGEERHLLKQDFDGAVDVLPVSDPNIFSQTQRIALCQGTLQLQMEAPDLYTPPKRVEAHRRMLAAMRVPDLDAVAPELKSPKYLDPVAEFQIIMTGGPVKAFETQQHEAHLQVHAHQRAFLMGTPSFMQMQPERQQMILGALDAHEADHMALLYRQIVMSTAGIPMLPADESGESPELPPEIEMRITMAVMQRLPPPPPPVQGQGQGDDTMAKAQAQIEAKRLESEASIERDTQAFIREEQRKQRAWEAEERRKDESTQAEIVRQGAKAKLELTKGAAVAGQQLSAKEQAAQQQLQHKEMGARQQMGHKEAGAGQQLRHKEQGAQQQLGHKAAAASLDRTTKRASAEQDRELKGSAATQDRELKAAAGSQDRELKGKSAAQDRRLTDSKAKQEQRLTEQQHQQGTRHTEEQHEQAVQILKEDHAIEAQHKQEDHKLQTKQAEQSGKLKLQQTKEQMRAKKAAGKSSKKKAAKK